jgi:DNA-directed RNA polymerase specialized sigma24 family protein
MYQRDLYLADDLAQEATIRLLRTLRREKPEELEKLMTTVASRTFADHLRRRKDLPMDPGDPRLLAQPAAHSEAQVGLHPLDLLDVVVRELLRKQDPACLRLHRQWRARRQWKEVAESMNPPSTAAAVRKKYSRCLQGILPRLRQDPRYARIAEYVESGEEPTQ